MMSVKLCIGKKFSQKRNKKFGKYGHFTKLFYMVYEKRQEKFMNKNKELTEVIRVMETNKYKSQEVLWERLHLYRGGGLDRN